MVPRVRVSTLGISNKRRVNVSYMISLSQFLFEKKSTITVNKFSILFFPNIFFIRLLDFVANTTTLSLAG